jgi:hypothetical protein
MDAAVSGNQGYRVRGIRLLLSLVLVAVSAMALTSCANRVQVYQYKNDSTLDHVYIKKGVDFKRFDSVMVENISIWHPSENGPSQERIAAIRSNLARMQEIFGETLEDALDDRYRIVDKPGRNTLRVEIQFIDLRSLPVGSPVPDDLLRYQFRTQAGHITMVARLFDSRSGELLARAADLGKRASAGGEAVVDWEAIATDFGYWTRVFRAWLDQEQGVPGSS